VAFGGVEEKEGGGDASRKDAFSLKWLRLSDGRCRRRIYKRRVCERRAYNLERDPLRPSF
jgi:hypothetical protein